MEERVEPRLYLDFHISGYYARANLYSTCPVVQYPQCPLFGSQIKLLGTRTGNVRFLFLRKTGQPDAYPWPSLFPHVLERDDRVYFGGASGRTVCCLVELGKMVLSSVIFTSGESDALHHKPVVPLSLPDDDCPQLAAHTMDSIGVGERPG